MRHSPVVMMIMLLALLAACTTFRMERHTMRVRVVTDPPGAVVEVTDAEGTRTVGRSPMDFEATYVKTQRKLFDRDNWYWMALPGSLLLFGGVLTGASWSPRVDLHDGVDYFISGLFMMSISAATLIVLGSVFNYSDAQNEKQLQEQLPFFVNASLPGYEGAILQVDPSHLIDTLELKLEPLISEELPAHGEVPLNEDQEREPEPGQDQQPAEPVESEQGQGGQP